VAAAELELLLDELELLEEELEDELEDELLVEELLEDEEPAEGNAMSNGLELGPQPLRKLASSIAPASSGSARLRCLPGLDAHTRRGWFFDMPRSLCPHESHLTAAERRAITAPRLRDLDY
jgi:hypothetical protein